MLKAPPVFSLALGKSLQFSIGFAGTFFGVLVAIFTVDRFLTEPLIVLPNWGYALVFCALPLAVLCGSFMVHSLTTLAHTLSTATISSLADLRSSSPALFSQIDHVVWSRVSPKDQAALYEHYVSLAPRATADEALAAPIQRQLELAAASPISAVPLVEFLDALGVPHHPIVPPMAADAYKRLRSTHDQLLETVVALAPAKLNERQAQCFRQLYEVLSCANLQAGEANKQTVDVVIVPGARWSHQQRVDQALLQHRVSGCDIILTGGWPRFSGGTDDRSVIAESEAMVHYLRSKVNSNVPDHLLHVENRATNSFESLCHSVAVLRRIALRREKALQIGLVTSSYHMLRFRLLAEHVFDRHIPNIKGDIHCITVPATIDLGQIIDGTTSDQHQRNIVFRTFVSEYLKLLGGRITGEF